MKKITKILAIFMVFMLCVNTAMPFAFAEGLDDGKLTAQVSSESGMIGENVVVKIDLKNNPGLTSLKFRVNYDEILTLKKVEFNSAFGDMVTAKEPYGSPQTLSFISPFKAVSYSGTFATLTFAISESAKDGDKANISLAYNADDIIDGNDKVIELNVVNGTVSVFEGLPGDINADGAVNNADAILLFRYVADWEVDVDYGALDCNGDGFVNNADAIILFRYTADWPVNITRGKVCVHELTATERKEATCTDDGNIAYWHCEKCGRYFSDANATTIITREDTVIAAGHKIVVDPYVAPTDTTPGKTEGSHCSECNKVIVPQEEIPIPTADTYTVVYHLWDNDTEYLKTVELENPNKTVNKCDKALRLQPIVTESDIGFTFEYWYQKGEDKATTVIAADTMESGETIHLYAKWTKNEYTITFDNSSMNLPSSTKKYTVDQKVTLDKPTVDRYVFLGWTTDSDDLVSEIKPGTTGNITLHSNWTSKRNLTKPVAALGKPIIVEDTNEGRLLFTYEIGQVENVPLYTIKDLPSAGGVVSVYTETVKKSIGTTDASTIAKAIDHTTTDSTAWTLSEDWNETTHVEDSVLEEHGYDRTTGQQVGKTSSNTYTLTTNEYDNTVVKANEGTIATTTQYNTTDVNSRETWESKASLSVSDTESAKYTDSAKVSAEVGVGWGPVSAKMGASAETSTEISSSTTAGAAAETTVAHENTSHSKTGTDTVTVADNTKATTTDKGWSKTSNSSSSSSTSLTKYEEQTLSERIANEYTYGQSYAKGGSNSNSAAWSTSTGESNQYSSTLTYFNSEETTEGVSYTINGEADGSYRLVRAGIVHVFAVVIYDIANAQYTVTTYAVLDDKTYTYIDYSATSAAQFNDNENGVLPFEIPYDINDYVNGRIVATEGLEYSEATLSTGEYKGTDTSVIIPEFFSLDNYDDTRSAYTVRNLSADTFSGKADIKSVILSNYIREIPASAFAGCESLEFVYGSEISSIGSYAFDGCTSLGKFKVSSTIKSIGENAFRGVDSIVVEASNKDVVLGAINSGAKNITINVSAIADKMSNVTLQIPDTVEYFEIQGGRNSFSGLKIKSDAGTTVINGITITDSTSIPLEISSESVTLNQVIVESPSYVLLLKSKAPTVSLYGTSRFISYSENAVVCRNVTFDRINPNVGSKLEITGNVLAYGDPVNASLISFPEKGKIDPLTADEYEKYIKGSFFVDFDANGGMLEADKIVSYVGTALGTLPTPTRDYYTFDGWYTEKEGGEEVTEETVYNGAADITLYAHWTQNPLSDWVKKSNMPSEAKAEQSKWTLNVVTTKAASAVKESNWTLTNTTSKWGEYGAWSNWSRTKPTASDSRQVDTPTEVLDENEYTIYHYYIYRSTDGIGCGTQNYNAYYSGDGKYHKCTVLDTLDLTYELTTNTGNGTVGYEQSKHSSYAGKSWCNTWFPNGSTYHPKKTHLEYRYRDRSLIYTYSFEATSNPTGNANASNIVEWVRYRNK